MVKLYNGWTLRYRQEECHDKCVKAYFAHSKEFLIAAVCRFGKTITTLQTLKDITDRAGSESEAILVLCTMSVKEEWKVANYLKKYDGFAQHDDCSIDDLTRLHNGKLPTDVGFLISHRESANGHLPYSKSSPQYRWNVLHDLSLVELTTIWTPRTANNKKTNGILILLPSQEERER